jgi:hypothetical protein
VADHKDRADHVGKAANSLEQGAITAEIEAALVLDGRSRAAKLCQDQLERVGGPACGRAQDEVGME